MVRKRSVLESLIFFGPVRVCLSVYGAFYKYECVTIHHVAYHLFGGTDFLENQHDSILKKWEAFMFCND